MGDSGVAQAAPFTLKIGRSTPLPRICKIYSMCKALRKTLATQHGGNLVAHTSRAAELAAASQAVVENRTHVGFTQKHERGGPHRAPW